MIYNAPFLRKQKSNVSDRSDCSCKKYVVITTCDHTYFLLYCRRILYVFTIFLQKRQQRKKQLWNHCIKDSCGMNESILFHSCNMSDEKENKNMLKEVADLRERLKFSRGDNTRSKPALLEIDCAWDIMPDWSGAKPPPITYFLEIFQKA